MKKNFWASFLWKDLFGRILTKEKSRLEFLKTTAFFHGFSDDQVNLTGEFLHERKFANGEFVFEKGHPGAALYFIQSGQVAIEIPSDNDTPPVPIATLAAGAFFGELALLDDAPRSASARADGEVVLLALPRSELERLQQQSPLLGGLVFKALAKITSARLKATIERMQGETRHVKVAVNG